MKIQPHWLCACFVFLSSFASGQGELGKVTLDEYQLSLDFTNLPSFTQPSEGLGDQLKVRWTGKLGRSDVYMSLFILDSAQFDLFEPTDVLTVVEENKAQQDRSAAGDRPVFAFDSKLTLPGNFGYVTYGALGFDTAYSGTRAISEFYALCGLLPTQGYALEVRCDPPLDDESRPILETFLHKGVSWAGEPRDPNWKEEEIMSRWESDAPDKVLEKGKLNIVRSKYYAIMTNVGKGTAKSFGGKMDEAYEKVREVYPFEDVEGQRLLPIFYFVTPDQYFEWFVKNLGGSMEAARRSGGVASGDVYSTYHQSTTASVHIHEATHQIFRNRKFLGGGGSWYQEGVARYIDSAPSALSQFKGNAKRGKFTPFEKFFTIRSLLFSSDANNVKGGNEAGDSYLQAASIVEFVRHSKFGKDKFQEYIEAIGKVPRGDLPGIEKALRKIYGVDVKGFQDEYVKYWKKRKSPKKK